MERLNRTQNVGLFLLCIAAFIPAVAPPRTVLAAEKEQPVDMQIEKLIARLKSGDAKARKAAAEALIKIGAAAVEPLTAAQKDADQPLKDAIDYVVKKIGAAPAWPPNDPRCTLKSDPKQEYFVYVPRDFDPKKTYWVFVSVHGLGGNGQGAVGYTGFADELKCIVVGPSFSVAYQFPALGAGKVMRDIFDEIKQCCKVQPRMYVTGISAGAQFAHRFALQNPELTVGCAAHSAGGWDAANKQARDVPFLVTCGEDDTTRLEPAKRFAQSLEARKYRSVETAWFPGVGHTLCPQAVQLTKEHFWTAVTGLKPDERKQAEDDLQKAGRLIDGANCKEAVKLLNRIAAFEPKSTFTERAAAGLERIRKAAADKLAEVEKQSEADPQAAMAALDRLRKDFAGTPGADVVERKRQALLKRPDVVAGREKEKDNSAAKELYEAAEKLLAEKRYAQALDKLKAAAQFAETPYGQKAAEKIKQIVADPAALQAQQADDCRKWLRLAKNYCTNNMPDSARPLLQKIVKTCPDSPEAEEAQKLLKEMK